MTNPSDDKFVDLLKQSVPRAGQELQRDLWPKMLSRLQERSVTVPWFDWALLTALAVGLCLAPSTIPVLLYHL